MNTVSLSSRPGTTLSDARNALNKSKRLLATAREKLDKAQLSLNIQEEKLDKAEAEAIKLSFGKGSLRRKSKTRKSKKKGI